MLHVVFLRAGTPNPYIVQRSTIIYNIYTVYMIFLKKKKKKDKTKLSRGLVRHPLYFYIYIYPQTIQCIVLKNYHSYYPTTCLFIQYNAFEIYLFNFSAFRITIKLLLVFNTTMLQHPYSYVPV